MRRFVIFGGGFEKIGGLEELLRCIEMIPRLDGGKLLSRLDKSGNGFVRQKAGYILEHYRDDLGLSDDFFRFCAEGLPGGKRYLYKGLQFEPHIFNAKWRLYTPPELAVVTSQGYVER